MVRTGVLVYAVLLLVLVLVVVACAARRQSLLLHFTAVERDVGVAVTEATLGCSHTSSNSKGVSRSAFLLGVSFSQTRPRTYKACAVAGRGRRRTARSNNCDWPRRSKPLCTLAYRRSRCVLTNGMRSFYLRSISVRRFGMTWNHGIIDEDGLAGSGQPRLASDKLNVRSDAHYYSVVLGLRDRNNRP